jgi:hypothetical protein
VAAGRGGDIYMITAPESFKQKLLNKHLKKLMLD